MCSSGKQARSFVMALSRQQNTRLTRLPALTQKNVPAHAQAIPHALPPPSPPQPASADTPLLEPLSAQEQCVLTLLMAGRSNPEIAEELIISVNTVKSHVKNLYRKLNVNNRVEAGTAARRLKLI